MPEFDSPRIGFAGTPEFARIILQHLLNAGVRPVLVLTQPDRPAGRKRLLVASPVKQLASAHSLPISQPSSLRPRLAQKFLAEQRLDLLVVAAYGLILPQAVLDLPAHGCINVHASLLPRWRGAAPIERAIMAGDAVTGVALMKMEAGLDTGPVFGSSACTVDDAITGGQLETVLAEQGARLLVQWLPALLAGNATPVPQPLEGVTYASKLSRVDAFVDWRQDARDVALQVRALVGRVTAEARIARDRVQLLRAIGMGDTLASGAPGEILASSSAGIVVRCGQGALAIQELRMTDRGKGTALTAREACNGFADLFAVGRCFDVVA